MRNVPLGRPSIGPAEIKAVTEALTSGWLAHGEYNHRFEHAFAKLIGVPHAISLNSCTSALEIALAVAGIKGEVIIPSFTWVATANVCVLQGATPVFCEVDAASRNVTAATIAAHITPRTEAVIVVHYAGQPCAMDEIVALCERHRLLLIEDSAETLGATWKGRQAGSFGMGCYSFFPTKNVTTGEGGMLTCRDDAFAAKARALIAHGVSSSTFEREKVQRPWLRAASMPGHNYRMSNILAALGEVQLARLDEMNAARARIAERYTAGLAPLANTIEPPVVTPGATHSWQMYTVLAPEARRDRMVLGLRGEGVGASVHFDPPAHLQPAYLERGCREGMLPVTEMLARRLITLPIFPDMTDEDVDWVSGALGRLVS
jgi:perosamine synthetase